MRRPSTEREAICPFCPPRGLCRAPGHAAATASGSATAVPHHPSKGHTTTRRWPARRGLLADTLVPQRAGRTNTQAAHRPVALPAWPRCPQPNTRARIWAQTPMKRPAKCLIKARCFDQGIAQWGVHRHHVSIGGASRETLQTRQRSPLRSEKTPCLLSALEGRASSRSPGDSGFRRRLVGGRVPQRDRDGMIHAGGADETGCVGPFCCQAGGPRLCFCVPGTLSCLRRRRVRRPPSIGDGEGCPVTGASSQRALRRNRGLRGARGGSQDDARHH